MIELNKTQLKKLIAHLEEKEQTEDMKGLVATLRQIVLAITDDIKVIDIANLIDNPKILKAVQEFVNKSDKDFKADAEGEKGAKDARGEDDVEYYDVRFNPDPVGNPDIVLKEREKIVTPVKENLKEIKKLLEGGSEGTASAILTDQRCNEPIVAGMSGFISGFLPRLAYHYSPLAADNRLKKKLEAMSLGSTPNKKAKSNTFKKILKYLRGKKYGTVLLTIAGLGAAFRPDLFSDAFNASGRMIKKPLEEFKTVSELFTKYTSWSKALGNSVTQGTKGELVHYTLDPCFAAAFVLGLTGLSLVRIAKGQALKTDRIRSFFKELDRKTYGSADEFLKDVRKLPGGEEWVQLVEDTMQSIKVSYEQATDIIKGFQPELQEPAAQLLRGEKPSVELTPEQLNNIQQILGKQINDIKTAKAAAEAGYGKFLSEMKEVVSDSLAANLKFFQTFDVVPGVRITSEQVGYLNNIVKESTGSIKSSLSEMDAARAVYQKSLNKVDDIADKRKILVDIEKTLDSKIKAGFSTNKEAIDAALSSKQKKFLAELPEETSEALEQLYIKKVDVLNKIDEHEATAKMIKGFDDERLEVFDSNTYSEISKTILKKGEFEKRIISSLKNIERAGGYFSSALAVTSLAQIYRLAVSDLDKQLSRKNIQQIHNFLKSPSVEDAKKVEVAIASVYSALADEVKQRGEDNPITYEELFGTSVEQAIKKGMRIDVEGFDDSTQKAIAIILVFNYLKSPSQGDYLSDNFIPSENDTVDQKINIADEADPKRLRMMAYKFKNKNVMSEEEYNSLFQNSYFEVKESLERFASKAEIKLKDETPTKINTDENPKKNAEPKSDQKTTPTEKEEYSLKEIYNITKDAAPKWATEDDIIKLAAVTAIESGGIRKAYADASTGLPDDQSYGLWQINMLGSLGPARRKKYKLESNEDLYDPKKAVKVAWGIYDQARRKRKDKNGIAPWNSTGVIGSENTTEEKREKKRKQKKFKNAIARTRRAIGLQESKQYKLNDLRNLVTEVINEQDTVQGTLDRIKSDPYEFSKVAYPGQERDAEDSVSHKENSVIKAKDSEEYNTGGREYYKKIVDQAQKQLPFGDHVYIVKHENLAMARQPVILEKDAADQFYEFLERWPTGRFGKLKLNDKTATWDSVAGGSDRSPTSQHKHGNAIDINVPFPAGSKNHLKFKEAVLDIALSLNFNGFGFGPNVVHIDTRVKPEWWIYGSKDKFAFLEPSVQNLIPLTARSFQELVYSTPGGNSALRSALAQITGKRRIREMKKNDLDKLVAEFLNENTGQGYGEYPYRSDSYDDDEPAEDYIEEWKALEIDLVRDETRNTAIAVAKILVKDLELFNDVLDLAGQNQSIGTEILRKLKETKVKS